MPLPLNPRHQSTLDAACSRGRLGKTGAPQSDHVRAVRAGLQPRIGHAEITTSRTGLRASTRDQQRCPVPRWKRTRLFQRYDRPHLGWRCSAPSGSWASDRLCQRRQVCCWPRAVSRRAISPFALRSSGRWRILRQRPLCSNVVPLPSAASWDPGGRFYPPWACGASASSRHPLLLKTRLLPPLASMRACSATSPRSPSAPAFCFGLAPALRRSRLDINPVLKDGGHGASTRSRARQSLSPSRRH